jgi:hypothetical protein
MQITAATKRDLSHDHNPQVENPASLQGWYKNNKQTMNTSNGQRPQSNNEQIFPNISFFYLLPNELVDQILFYIFNDITSKDLSLTNSTIDEFAVYFSTKAFKYVDIEKVKFTLYKDMLIELSTDFLRVDRRLNGNIKCVLGQVLREQEEGREGGRRGGRLLRRF